MNIRSTAPRLFAGVFLFFALAHLSHAADSEGDALYHKAIAAQTGKGAAFDLAAGKALLLKAAEAGSGRAMSRLGAMYETPDGGVPIDLAEARKWFDKAAAVNDPYGLLWSANLNDHTLKPDEEKARFAKAYEVSKDAALKDPTAVFVVAVCFSTGRGAPFRDMQTSVEALQQAADDAEPNAMRELAASYAHGDGVAKDPKKAFEWYSKAAETGLAVHLMDLGICYDSGIGVARDYATAIKYYQQAADRGSARSMTNLAQMIADGQGAPVDLAKSAGLFQKAADLGWPPAMYYLGMCYDSGKGIEQNHDSAVKWIRKSAAWKNPRAKKYLADHQMPEEAGK